MDISAILSTQGLLLTLVSLLGTFFYVHLSNWRKDIIKLQAKWEQNKFNQTDEEKASVLQVRYELPGLNNYVTPLVTAVISSFILLIAVLSLILWTDYAGPEQLRTLLTIAGGAFLVLYLVLTGVFLFGGIRTANIVETEIEETLGLDPADS